MSVEPTITALAAAEVTWDAIIIGAGPAGRSPLVNWRGAASASCWSSENRFRAPRSAAAV